MDAGLDSDLNPTKLLLPSGVFDETQKRDEGRRLGTTGMGCDGGAQACWRR